MDQKWTSLHIFYHDVSKYDEFIIKICTMLDQFRKEGKLEKWFFIRYWEGGPHIRVRMLRISKENVEVFKNMAYFFMRENPSRHLVSREEYYKDNKFDGKSVNPATLPWYEDGEIVEISYEQEIQRYGGEAVMNMSETIFCYSSCLVKSILESTKDSFHKKLIFTEALTWIEVEEFRKVYGGQNQYGFLNIYQKNWESFLYHTENEKQIQTFFETNEKSLINAREILRNNQKFMHLIQLIKDEIQEIAEHVIKLDYMDYIMASQIHMTNNRLGVVPIFEYFIAQNLLQQGKEGIENG